MSRSAIVSILLLLLLIGGKDVSGQAHCFCRATVLEHRTTNPNDYKAMANVSNIATGKFTIPGWNKKQQFDVAASAANAVGSCRWECRKAFGVLNGNVSQEAAALKAQLVSEATAKGQPFDWCGGWLSTSLEYAAGTNPYKNATTELVGIGGVRTCGSVSQALASCTWTNWLDSDDPPGPGDFELLQNFQAAGQVPSGQPKFIDCQTLDGQPAYASGQAYTCSVAVGGACLRVFGRKCKDYRVRFCF